MATSATGRPTVLERGRTAFESLAWADAHDLLSAADAEAPLALEDLERLAIATYLIGRYTDSMELSRRGYQESVRRGDVRRAVRSAFWVAVEHLGRGEMAPATGWLARAERLVEGAGGGASLGEAGYLFIAEGVRSLAIGDPAAALAANEQALEHGTTGGDNDVVLLARIGIGESLIAQGEVERGIRLMDEAMAGVTSGEASPVVTGIAYCSVIAACQQVFDLRRAGEWTAALDAWCASQPQLVHFRGQCLLNRAQLLQLHGSWDEAADGARQAEERLAEPMPDPSLGEAVYQAAELHRLRGDVAAAEAAYRRASRLGRPPEPGIALLRLAQGRTELAAATIVRATDEATGIFQRARLLEPLTEILLATGSTDGARLAADELTRLASEVGAPLLAAQAGRAAGAVLISDGEPMAALAALRPALAAWQSLDAPYDAARTRVLIGMACRALGDADAATLELDAAGDVFRRLGAGPDLARVNGLLGGPAASTTSRLSPRELEVLQLVAAGKSNRAIAGELVISDRTVARHLSNIFDKLDVSSRAAATAYAYEHGLIAPPA